ncbi:uncharacterized protein LOC126907984 isoform X2 [Daktulosphaira vitifoliae]|uniref:uncharacterized protein LOC126907984 isoform X2 n=1 Tax=Daktulosphaira vitifoliae TaxID=58002 RepID=UPI0021AA1F79|nr:uncharacterized protein LOC126907984 isoform X2 [Daktulosphaira vitifoliae]
MVCLCMVTFLVLLNGPFGTSQSVAPTFQISTKDLFNTESANFTELSSPKCKYKGRKYEQGSIVNTDQPCLKCTCNIGNLVCHLQVCPELPDPPPQGCVIVHKKNKCCAHLQCFYDIFGHINSKLFKIESRTGPARMENSEIMMVDESLSRGCTINGTIYAEGSAMDSSSICEYCYCFKGQQHCVSPRCSLVVPGCTAIYNKHTCCPVRYNCPYLHTELTENNITNITFETYIPSSLSSRIKDCHINGRLISLGEPVIGVARSSCETCFCINGQVRCDKVICPPIRTQISPNCGPVYTEGHCCPTSYNCTGNNKNDSNINIKIVSSPPSSTPIDYLSNSSSTLTHPKSPLLQHTTSSSVNVTEFALPSLYSPESRNGDDNPMNDFNITQKSGNVESDYDEAGLPPSLPNLKIIPFVAADAVVDNPIVTTATIIEPIKRIVHNVSDTDDSFSLDVINFSPPMETEGGFIPKESLHSGEYVHNKQPIINISTSKAELLIKTTTIQPEEANKNIALESDWCLSNGKKHKHGELLTDPSACNICVCFEGKIVCQENCPAVKIGCQRISDPKNNTCCGRIICNNYENNVTTERHIEQIKMSETTPQLNLFTLIKNPVIEHIILTESATDSSIKRTLSTTPKISTISKLITHKPTTTTVKRITTSLPFTENPSNIYTTNAVKFTTPLMYTKITTTEKSMEDEDYSFESMFSFLFSNENTKPPIASPTKETLFSSEDFSIEKRTDEDVDKTIQSADVKVPVNNSVITKNDVEKINGSSILEFNTRLPLKNSDDSNHIISQSKVENVNITNYHNDVVDNRITKFSVNKLQYELKPLAGLNKTTENKINIVKKNEGKPLLDVKYQSVADFKPSTGLKYPGFNSHLENKQNVELQKNSYKFSSTVKSLLDYKLKPDEKQFSDFKPSEFNPHTELKPLTVKPIKNKLNSNNNSATSLLRISGCNIYGKMYMIGKIITELSAACSECLCTDVGVQCSPLKC